MEPASRIAKLLKSITMTSSQAGLALNRAPLLLEFGDRVISSTFLQGLGDRFEAWSRRVRTLEKILSLTTLTTGVIEESRYLKEIHCIKAHPPLAPSLLFRTLQALWRNTTWYRRMLERYRMLLLHPRRTPGSKVPPSSSASG